MAYSEERQRDIQWLRAARDPDRGARPDGQTIRLAYDALGRRVRKTVAETSGGATTTRTIDDVYDAEDVILAVETTDAGGTPTTVTTRYVHGPGIDEPLLVEQGAQGYAAHADALGSLTGLSDGSQTLAEASTYTSFGQLTRSGTATGNPYAYTGREWEPELGLSTTGPDTTIPRRGGSSVAIS